MVNLKKLKLIYPSTPRKKQALLIYHPTLLLHFLLKKIATHPFKREGGGQELWRSLSFLWSAIYETTYIFLTHSWLFYLVLFLNGSVFPLLLLLLLLLFVCLFVCSFKRNILIKCWLENVSTSRKHLTFFFFKRFKRFLFLIESIKPTSIMLTYWKLLPGLLISKTLLFAGNCVSL